MNKYTVKEKTITQKIYTTCDGSEFTNKQYAYDHAAHLFTEDVLENTTNTIDIDSSLFTHEYITSWKFSNKNELDMFLYGFLDAYEMYNEEEIKDEAQNRTSFPCTLCATENEIFFKEDFIEKIENILNMIKEDL